MTSRRSLPGTRWHRLERLIEHDFSDDSLLQAVGEGRGVTFQRLEFLGDRVLELAVATALVHGADAGNEMASLGLARIVAERTDNDHLARSTMAADLSRLLRFRASRKRRGDVVEAAAGALFLDGGWRALDLFAVTLGLSPGTPKPAGPAEDLASSAAAAPEADRARIAPQVVHSVARTLGGLSVDATFAWWAFRTMPDRDEGVLTAVVHERTSNVRLATVARRWRMTQGGGHPENRLRERIGLVCLHEGRATAIAETARMFHLGSMFHVAGAAHGPST